MLRARLPEIRENLFYSRLLLCGRGFFRRTEIAAPFQIGQERGLGRRATAPPPRSVMKSRRLSRSNRIYPLKPDWQHSGLARIKSGHATLPARKQAPKSSTATYFHASDGPQLLVKSRRIPTIATTHSDESRTAVPIDCNQCGAMTGTADCRAHAVSGQAAIAPVTVRMDSRRPTRIAMRPSGGMPMQWRGGYHALSERRTMLFALRKSRPAHVSVGSMLSKKAMLLIWSSERLWTATTCVSSALSTSAVAVCCCKDSRSSFSRHVSLGHIHEPQLGKAQFWPWPKRHTLARHVRR